MAMTDDEIRYAQSLPPDECARYVVAASRGRRRQAVDLTPWEFFGGVGVILAVWGILEVVLRSL